MKCLIRKCPSIPSYLGTKVEGTGPVVDEGASGMERNSPVEDDLETVEYYRQRLARGGPLEYKVLGEQPAETFPLFFSSEIPLAGRCVEGWFQDLFFCLILSPMPQKWFSNFLDLSLSVGFGAACAARQPTRRFAQPSPARRRLRFLSIGRCFRDACGQATAEPP